MVILIFDGDTREYQTFKMAMLQRFFAEMAQLQAAKSPALADGYNGNPQQYFGEEAIKQEDQVVYFFNCDFVPQNEYIY